jgi:hypothetical protein
MPISIFLLEMVVVLHSGELLILAKIDKLSHSKKIRSRGFWFSELRKIPLS